MRLAAIDLVATLDTLSSLTEAGWWFPGRLPSSLSLSLVTWDRVLRDVVVEARLFVDLSTRPDVLGLLYTLALNIVVLKAP